MAGILSKGITLSYKAGEASEYTKLTNLQEIPELGNAATRERVDVTTLDDDKRKSIAGLQEEGETELTFKFLHEKEQFQTLIALTGVIAWEVALPDGIKCTFNGTPSVKMDSAGVNAALTYTLGISVDGEFVFA
jgi:hypothetical protein